MNILILQFQNSGGPEAFGGVLKACGATLDICNFDSGGTLPASIDGYDGLLVLGGVMNAHDDADYPYLSDVAALIAEFHHAARPVLGICLGAQLIARALGGRAYFHTVPEVGFVEISLNDEAAADPLLAGLETSQYIMEWHYQTFDMPPGSHLLATSELCSNQIYRVGEATYGFQCHFEVSQAMIQDWTAGAKSSLPDDDDHNNFIATIDDQINCHIGGSLAFCETIAARWTDFIGARRAA